MKADVQKHLLLLIYILKKLNHSVILFWTKHTFGQNIQRKQYGKDINNRKCCSIISITIYGVFGDFKKENTNPNSTEYTNNTFNNK